MIRGTGTGPAIERMMLFVRDIPRQRKVSGKVVRWLFRRVLNSNNCSGERRGSDWHGHG